MKMIPRMRTIIRYSSGVMKSVIGIPANLPMANAPQKPNENTKISKYLYLNDEYLCTRSHVGSSGGRGSPNLCRVRCQEAAICAFNSSVHANEYCHKHCDCPEQPGLHRLLVQWVFLGGLLADPQRLVIVRSRRICSLVEKGFTFIVFFLVVILFHGFSLFILVGFVFIFVVLLERWTEA